jgi:erythromycin esterase
MATLAKWFRSSRANYLWLLPITLGACSSDDAPVEPPPPPPISTQLSGLPGGWSGGWLPTVYELGRDTEINHSGRYSAYLRSLSTTQASTSAISLWQSVRADLFRGRRVRLSGYLKVSDVSGVGFGLRLQVDDAHRTRVIDGMANRRQLGTKDWTYAQVVLDVPNDALGLQVGAVQSGSGTAWVDDIRLEVVGSDIAVTAPPSEGGPFHDSLYVLTEYQRAPSEPRNLDFEGIPQAELEAASVEWMKANSVPFDTDDPFAPSDSDLVPLDAMIGSASLIAMGEATHGTRQFFRMKHRVFQYLVEHHGFDHFSIEASLPEAMAVDYFVQTGVGNPATLIRGMHFWTWTTQEVVALVTWMQQWNKAGRQPRLRFSGFDMQYAGVAVDSVLAFARSLSTSLGDSVHAAYQCLDAARESTAAEPSSERYRQLPAGVQQACRAAIAGVDSLFARRAGEWTQVAGEDRTLLMQRLARIVSQWEDNARTFSRDRWMAENVAWWKSRNRGAGMMLWAHNGHINRHPGWMGMYLKDRFGADYLNMALTFSSGFFNAILQVAPGEYRGLTSHPVGGSWPGSIEALMDATGRARAILDTRAMLTGGPVATSLRHRLTMRSMGATFSRTTNLGTYQWAVALPDDYDIVIWFKEAGPSQLIQD